MPSEFVATDGTVFKTKKEWRKYEFLTNYTFKDLSDEKVRKEPGQINGQPFDICGLKDCEVVLADFCDQVQIDDCVNCKIFVGACSESVFARNCSDCEFYVACKQLRLRECFRTSFSLYSQTEPVIEMSNGISFSPFSGGYAAQASHFEAARLNPDTNFWWAVFDFNDEEKTGNNFSLSEEPQAPWYVTNDTIQCALQTKIDHAPRPSTLEGSGSNSHGPTTAPPSTENSFQSFAINTSQQDAQRSIEPQVDEATAALPPPPPPVDGSIDMHENDKTHENIPPPVPTTDKSFDDPNNNSNKNTKKEVAAKDDANNNKSWEAVRLGIRYQPMVLAIQYKEFAQDAFAQKDIHIDSLNDNDTPESLLDRLQASDHKSFLDFDHKISKRQVLRLLGMLIDRSRAQPIIASS